MRQFLVFITVVLLSALFSVYAFAEECRYVTEEEAMCQKNEFADRLVISPLYTNISAIYANLSINGATSYCNGRIQTATSGATTSVSVYLQRSTDGVTWSTLKTWSGSGTYSADASGQYAISSGYQYRVSVYGSVRDQNGSLLESATKYSAVKTY